jgi:uncharacterized protein YcbX
MRVAAIHTYPVKGCYRFDHREAAVESWGLAGDRRWLILDADGVMLTQREDSAMVRIKPESDGDRLTLRADGHSTITVEPQQDSGELIDFKVHRTPIRGIGVGDAADSWLSGVLDRKVRLMWLDDPTRRAVDQQFGEPSDRVSFADDFPVSLGNLASLAALNDLIIESGSDEGPLPMARFRPNIEVSGAAAWAEDGWVGGRVRIGDVVFRAPKGLGRCVVTTTDQEVGVRGREPLRSLGRHRNVDQELLFALALIPENTGTIAVDDEITVEAR